MFNLEAKRKLINPNKQLVAKHNQLVNQSNSNNSDFIELSKNDWMHVAPGTVVNYEKPDGKIVRGNYAVKYDNSSVQSPMLWVQNNLDTKSIGYATWPIKLDIIKRLWKHVGQPASSNTQPNGSNIQLLGNTQPFSTMYNTVAIPPTMMPQFTCNSQVGSDPEVARLKQEVIYLKQQLDKCNQDTSFLKHEMTRVLMFIKNRFPNSVRK